MGDDVEDAIDFCTTLFDFEVLNDFKPAFADVAWRPSPSTDSRSPGPPCEDDILTGPGER